MTIDTRTIDPIVDSVADFLEQQLQALILTGCGKPASVDQDGWSA